MSPVIARAALRSTLARTAGQRNFSVMRELRNFARGFEPHPFQRLPVTSNPQAADWGKQVKRIAGQAAIYFPAMAVLLGWPYGTKVLMDGHV
ncbi:hypothetical protein QBC46DRAFT_350805 [Diplogelasinospora grovesii]|uniref:Uncharacterized protein n=1 Tax=Diplogelasinospora grovesii TaxID=303347 RepID=A0AAN6NE44_9PEZI|nr:hypothetical protein QBC46DRAFT_350805 [Diplogelasinospora grovesii]